jgi:hypothetical protein
MPGGQPALQCSLHGHRRVFAAHYSTLVTERAASRGHGGIGSGMDDGSGIGIGAKHSSWVFDFHGV